VFPHELFHPPGIAFFEGFFEGTLKACRTDMRGRGRVLQSKAGKETGPEKHLGFSSKTTSYVTS
jgi:hypothetical protein